MPSITIWALESDHDAEAVRCFAEKLVSYLKYEKVFIRAVGCSAKPKRLKGEDNPAQSLSRAVKHYLKQDKCLIFVIDKDGLMASQQRKQEPNSLINQIGRIVKDKEFEGRVHLAWMVNELEAWLLIDCKGIFCYFAHKKNKHKKDCGNEILENRNIMRLIKKHQKGNTESIVEAESGGKGVKEYLRSFSKEILKTLNPKMKLKDIDDEKYRESLSPEIARYVEIDSDTLRRNNSLRYLGKLISQCQS